MMENKRCIFHIPNHIEENGKSGSSLRPAKMLEAFKNIGYLVDVVMGYGETRKEQIEKIRRNLKDGIKYDFLYSESSTMPTLLTERNHFPKYPLLDFGLFSLCRKNNIKIGLFYRDIHWRFELYKNAVGPNISRITLPFYKYDLMQYNKYLDVLYLASSEVKKYVPIINDSMKIELLPPGSIKNVYQLDEKTNYYKKNRDKSELQIFYVGGIGEIYDIEGLLKAINEKKYAKLTLCCRKKEWDNYKEQFAPYLTDRVTVIHKTGIELEEHYLKADICSCYFANNDYMDMAMPVKMFEYLGHGIPVIATSKTVAGEFIKETNFGWTIDHNHFSLGELLDEIFLDQDILFEKHTIARQVLEKNTWQQRALKVANDLSMSI